MGIARNCSFLLSAAVIAAALGTAGISHAAEPSDLPPLPSPSPKKEEAKIYEALRKEGNELAAAGRIPEALSAWTRAYALRPGYALACDIGRVELLRRVDAVAGALWLTRCVRHAPLPNPNQPKELAEQQAEVTLRDLARSKVGALRIEAEPGAEVAVDGRVIGKAPLEDEVFLAPGSHRIAVSLGSRSRSADVTLAGGEARVLDLASPAAPVGPVAVPSRVPAALPPGKLRGEPSGGGGSPTWPVAVGAVVTVGLVAASGGFEWASSAAAARGDEVLSSVHANGSGDACLLPKGGDPACAAHREHHADAATFGELSQLTLAGAGVAGVATLVFAVLRSQPEAVSIKADARGVRAVWSW